MLKKVLAYLLTLCMIFSCVSVQADDVFGTVYLTNAVTNPGKTVELELMLDGNTGFVNLGLEIVYDNSFMSLVAVNADSSVGATCTKAQKIDAVPYNIGWDSTENVYYNGRLATLVFEILPNAPEGVQRVYVDYYKGRNGNYTDGISVNYDEFDNPLNLSYGDGCIHIENNVSPPVSGGGGGGGGSLPADRIAAGLSTATAKAGETVDITLGLYNNTGFANLSFEIDYDSSVMELSAVNNNPSVGATFTSAQTIGTKPYNLGWDSVSDVTFNGTLATLSFTIAEDAPTGYYPLELSYYKGRNGDYIDGDSVNYDENENPLSILYLGGCIEVVEGYSEDDSYWVEFVSTKDTYSIGEEFDVQVWLYTNNSALRIFEDEYTVSGFDSTSAGHCTVTVSYEGYSRIFEVDVIDDKPVEPVVTYVVRADCSEGAVISPSGFATVKEGTNLRYVVSVQEGYILDSVTVNGEYVNCYNGALDVTIDCDTVIMVSAVVKTFTIETDTPENGRVELSRSEVKYGDSCTARIIPDNGYIVSDVIVNGISVGACRSYKFSDIKSNHTITAVFEQIIQTVNITAAAEKGGSVYPAKAVVNSGAGAKFTASPDYGYHISGALVNGEAVEVLDNEIYLDAVTEDSCLTVSFEKDLFDVSASSSEGAYVYTVYDGCNYEIASVPYMDNIQVIVEVEEGYKLNKLYVNNTPVKVEKTDIGYAYDLKVKEDTVISARCVRNFVSMYNSDVANAGLPAFINAENASEKLSEFEALANRYSELTEEEKIVCTSAYATVLAAIDRANAFIALSDTGIISVIENLPSPDKISSSNYRVYKKRIETAYNTYEDLTNLSKSLIDYSYSAKLKALKEKCDMLYKESMHIISYLTELVNAVPDGEISEDNLSQAYYSLMLAEKTYSDMNDSDKEQVSDDLLNNLFAKHGNIASAIQKSYATPFTAKVLRASHIDVYDSVEAAEAKRATIYELMNVYHSCPAYVLEQISDSTVQRLNSLFDSASIKVEAEVNNIPVDMHGDFDEDTKVVLSDPEPDKEEISSATGKSLYQAIDVKMYTDDIPVQPTSKIRIRLEINKAVSKANVSVVYIDDGGNIFDVQGKVSQELGKYYITFFIDHFSTFAVVYDENIAEKADIVFDSDYIIEGESLTATVGGAVNASGCNLWMAGYSSDGEITFIEKSSDGSVSALVAENTERVKAMLWSKNMMPITGVKEISINN